MTVSSSPRRLAKSLKRLAGILLAVAGWWIIAGMVIVVPFALAHFDFTDEGALGGVLVLALYVAILAALAVALIRVGRRLRHGARM